MTSIALNLLNHSISGSYEANGYDYSDSKSLVQQFQTEYERTINNVGLEDKQKAAFSNLKNIAPLVLNERLEQLIDNPNDLLFKFSNGFQHPTALNLNLLIEKTIADFYIDRKDKQLVVLSIQEAILLKSTIEDLKHEKAQIMEDLKASPNVSTVNKLILIDSNLSDLETEMNNHYVLTSQLGYIQNILSSESSIASKLALPDSSSQIERSLEDLVSTVMSLSIQSNIQLPDPNPVAMQSLNGRIEWCSNCISALVNGVRVQTSSSNSVPPSATSERFLQTSSKETKKEQAKQIDELKTALNDLQFAHNYLTRQYEDERSQYNKSLNRLRFKLNQSQELLNNSNSELSRQTNQLLKLEMKINELQIDANKTQQQLLKIEQENNLLKVDHLGESSNNHAGDQSTISKRNSSTPSTPPMAYSSYSDEGNPAILTVSSPTRNNVSAAILRTEFKRLVSKINAKFEKDLETERVEKERLHELLKIYENKSPAKATTKRDSNEVYTPPSTSSIV